MNMQTSVVFPEIFGTFVGTNLLLNNLNIVGEEHLPAWYKVTDLAAESIAAAGLMLQQRLDGPELLGQITTYSNGRSSISIIMV